MAKDLEKREELLQGFSVHNEGLEDVMRIKLSFPLLDT